MTIDPTTSTMPTATDISALNVANDARGGKVLGQDDFLKLLTVQLQSQDPMKPMEDTAFISQMASFTSLEQMKTLTENFASFQQSQDLSAAQSYLGKTVTVLDANSTTGDVTGAVSSIAITDGSPKLTINGAQYDLSMIQSISAAANNSAATSTGAISSAPSTPAASSN